MFLLPSAERYRRALAFLAVCLALSALAVWRPPVLDRLAAAALRPLASVTLPVAGWAADVFHGVPVEATETPPLPDGLAALERELGAPPSAAGVAWLEVPVVEVHRSAGRAVLGAGKEHGIAVGQPVAFGDQWLGRIAAAGEGWSELEYWTAANAKTGVWLDSGSGPPGRAFCFGRGRDKAPVLLYKDRNSTPEPGMRLEWRAPARDFAPDFRLPLTVGTLVSKGEQERANLVWEVHGEFPRGAEGRVFVGAGAVFRERVAEPPVRRSRANWALRADAVFGTRLAAAESYEPLDGVLLQSGRVFGPVVARRGRLAWAYRSAPEEWAEEALAVRFESQAMEAADRLEDEALKGAPLFTRGDARIPRGLWLGHGGDRPLPAARGVLEVVSRQEVAPQP